MLVICVIERCKPQKKKKRYFERIKTSEAKNKRGIRWPPLQFQTFMLTMVQRWGFVTLSWLSPSHTKNATSDLSILWLCGVDGPWGTDLCGKVLSQCLPVQLPPSGRWLGAQKVTAHEKKQHKHQVPINFCNTEFFTCIFQLPKDRQDLFYYSTAGLWFIWETYLFLKCCHTFFPWSFTVCMSVTLCVCACMCLCKCVCVSISLGEAEGES